MHEPRWEHFYHQADVGVRGLGRSVEEAFEQAAFGLVAVIADPDKVAGVEKIEITCNCSDPELLFVDWLNAVIYEMDTRKMLFSRFKVCIKDPHLSAEVYGEPLDAQKHQPAVEVKAATYTSLKVGYDRTGLWLAQCVVDV